MSISKKFFLLSLLLLLGYIVFISSHGLIINDEGYIIYGAQRVVNGQIPYKDFHFAYTPLSLYLTALSFSLFGTSIMVSRILMIGINLFGAYIMYRLLKNFIKNQWYIYLALCGYIFWGIGHINFPWPVMLAIPAGLAHSLFLLNFTVTKEKKYAFFAGLCLTVTFLIKQNFGVVLALQTFLCLIFLKELRFNRFLLWYIAGISSLFIPYGMYLSLTSSLSSFFSDLYNYTIVRIIVEKTLDTPFLYEDSFYGIFMKLFFYVLPLYLSCIAFWLSYRYNRSFLIIVFLVLLYYLVGIRPTTDYPHLVPLLALSSILIPFIVVYTQKNVIKKFVFVFFISFLGLGLWTSIYKNYYRYERPLIEATTFIHISQIGVWIPKEKSELIVTLRKEITQHTSKNEKIFVYYYAPFLYYFSERDNISPYDVHPANQQMQQYQNDVIGALEKENTKFVISYGDISIEDTRPLSQYIRKYYVVKKSAQDYFIWQRKSSMIR